MSEISKIDALLSVSFNECNIAAADAAKYVEEQFEQKAGDTKVHEVRSIGRFSAEQKEPFELLPLTDTQIEDPLFTDGKVSLALAKHIYIDDMPLSLVACFNRDSMMPIATFERRGNGQCSYVQIGQEIDEDALVVTPNTTRTDQVEAIRNVVKRDEVNDVLKQIIVSEAATYNCEIVEALTPEVVEAAQDYFAHNEQTVHDLKVIKETGKPNEPTEVQLLAVPITCISDSIKGTQVNGHEVSLLLGKEMTTRPVTIASKRLFGKNQTRVIEETIVDDSLGLYASVRGGVAFKLAGFVDGEDEDGPFKTVSGSDFDKTLTAESLTSMLSVLMTNDEQRKKMIDARERFTLWYDPRHVGLIVETQRSDSYHRRKASYIFQFLTGLPDEHEYHSGLINLQEDGITTWQQLKAAIAEMNDDNFKDDDELRELMTSDADIMVIRLLDQLRVGERLEAQFDHGETAHETVVRYALGFIATSNEVKLHTVLPNHKVGKTNTDVATETHIVGSDGKLDITIAGRPLALEGFDMTTLFDVSMNLTGKNKPHIDDDEIKEIFGVLHANRRITR